MRIWGANLYKCHEIMQLQSDSDLTGVAKSFVEYAINNKYILD